MHYFTWRNHRLPSPPQINSSVCLSVCQSVSDITFNYSAENLLTPTIKATIKTLWYQYKTISEHKYVSYEAQLCPFIAKRQRAPNAQLTHQIVDRHHEKLKSSGPDSQTLRNPF